MRTKPCGSCGIPIRSKGKVCRRCYLAKGSAPDRDHPWRHEPIDPRKKPPAPKEAPKKKGRPYSREIVFTGSLDQIRAHHALIDCLPEGITFRYEIRRPGDGE